MNQIENSWRSVISARCGGSTFDAPGGGYSFSNILAEERELSKANVTGDSGSALCKLSIADPVWKMPVGAMTAGLEYYFTNPDATRYTDNNGISRTHEAIAEFLDNQHSGSSIDFTPDWVQYSPGSIKRLLAEYLPTLLFDDRTDLFFPTPGYGVIKSDMNKRTAKVHDVPLGLCNGRWLIDTDRIEGLINGMRRSVVYLNAPHNPTGTAMYPREWHKIFEWARKFKVILIVDEAYTHLRFDGDSVSALDVHGWEDVCIVLQSVSQGWNATGLRFGYAVAHPTLIRALRKVMDVKDSGLFGPSIAAGLWCLNNPEILDETTERYGILHSELLRGLQIAGFRGTMPEAGLCQFTRAPKSVVNGEIFKDAVECAQWLRRVLRISVMNYTVNDEPWLRWAVTIKPIPECGLFDEKDVIREVVRRLQAVKFKF